MRIRMKKSSHPCLTRGERRASNLRGESTAIRSSLLRIAEQCVLAWFSVFKSICKFLPVRFVQGPCPKAHPLCKLTVRVVSRLLSAPAQWCAAKDWIISEDFLLVKAHDPLHLLACPTLYLIEVQLAINTIRSLLVSG